MDRRIDIAISVIAMLFGIFVILEARTIKAPFFADPIGPRAFFYGCGVIFILGGLVEHRAARLHLAPVPDAHDPRRGRRGRAGPSRRRSGGPRCSRWSASLYVLTLRPVGYLIGTPLYIVAGLWILEQRNWLLNITVGLVFTIVFYLIFAQGLGVWLPVGPFTQLFRDLGWIIL